jgi:hypothetical protein
VKNFIGTSTTEFILPNFSGVSDGAEIIVTLLKSQTDFTSSFSWFKGKIQQKYFNCKCQKMLHFPHYYSHNVYS